MCFVAIFSLMTKGEIVGIIVIDGNPIKKHNLPDI
jgi:hypothetical protein